MIKQFITILVLLLIFESSAQSNFQYEAGISFGYDILQPKSFENNYEYFYSSYNSGTGFNLGMSNKLNYKKLFLRLQVAYGIAFQSKEFIFSNEIDYKIDHTVKHQMPHWMLDYSIGRDFEINELNKLHLELGFSTIGNFAFSPSNSRFNVSGSFNSTYVAPEDHYDGSSVREYDYTIEHWWANFVSPFIKCGLSLPVAKNRLVFGVTARWNRLAYRNFIILSSDNYNAIANTRSQSSSFGIYLNYEFSK